MPSFAVVVVARNEAETLSRLVGSLGAFTRAGGTIDVIDTGSDDGTARAAHDLGCRVREMGDRFTTHLSEADAARIQQHFGRDEGPLVSAGERLFDFSAARRAAGELAGRDFVWQLDGSDEVLALDLDRVNERIERGDAGALSYRLRLGAGSFVAVRFYDRRWYRWRGRAHEALYPVEGPAPTGIPPTVSCDATELLVVHHRQQKARRYLAGLALDALASPATPRWRHYLGRELYYEGWYRSALSVLEQHAAMPDAPPAERCESLCVAGACLERLGRPDEAASVYSRAAAIDGTRREPLLRLAVLCNSRGHFGRASECATRALAIERRPDYVEADANYTWRPHAVLYWSLFWLGRHEDARSHWSRFTGLAPEHPWVRDHASLFRPAMSRQRIYTRSAARSRRLPPRDEET